ncbi:MAG: hypothetical protein H6998_20825 [Hahellaceae bacterium]|nr:hypothetical protein [Hahellaceae bacterium]
MNHIPIEFVWATKSEYEVLANKIGAVPFAKTLIMRDGIMIGCRSNRYPYILPAAYKVATGEYPVNYHGTYA